MDASNPKPVSVGTLDIHVEVTNTDDVDDNSDKTPGDGGEGIISEGQTIPDVDDNGDKEIGAGGAV